MKTTAPGGGRDDVPGPRVGGRELAGRGPQLELTLSAASSFFCHQVFFDDDPSSSTSLLSSVMDQIKADPFLLRGKLDVRRMKMQ